MSAETPAAGSSAPADAPVRRRDLAVARSLDSARLRSEGRVQRFLDAGFELLARAESGKEFTVQEVVDRSGQSLRSFYQYFAGKHELLLALFDEAIRSTADRLEEQIALEDTPLERLHRFVVEYYRMCLPAPKGRASKNNPTPVMAEFCHQLLTVAPGRGVAGVRAAGHPAREGPRRGGGGRSRPPRPGRTREVAGVILSTIMFNAAYAPTISGSEEPRDGDRAGEARSGSSSPAASSTGTGRLTGPGD